MKFKEGEDFLSIHFQKKSFQNVLFFFFLKNFLASSPNFSLTRSCQTHFLQSVETITPSKLRLTLSFLFLFFLLFLFQKFSFMSGHMEPLAGDSHIPEIPVVSMTTFPVTVIPEMVSLTSQLTGSHVDHVDKVDSVIPGIKEATWEKNGMDDVTWSVGSTLGKRLRLEDVRPRGEMAESQNFDHVDRVHQVEGEHSQNVGGGHAQEHGMDVDNFQDNCERLVFGTVQSGGIGLIGSSFLFFFFLK